MLSEAEQTELAAARHTFPEVRVADGAFEAYLALRRQHAADSGHAVLHPCVADLYLACACAAGDERAIARFEREYAREIAAAFHGLEGRGLSRDDVAQTLREHLFTRAPGGRAKIEEYSGLGRLRGWVRVTALRMRIDAERRVQARHEVALPEPRDVLEHAAETDPELILMKQHYRATFRSAVEAAGRLLTPRQRNLLRHKLVAGLTTAQIAALYGVHRATMKRWLAEARELLLKETRREFAARAGTDADGDFESAVRLIGSHFDVSVRALLAGHAEEHEG